jgi:chromosome segregation ATPase
MDNLSSPEELEKYGDSLIEKINKIPEMISELKEIENNIKKENQAKDQNENNQKNQIIRKESKQNISKYQSKIEKIYKKYYNDLIKDKKEDEMISNNKLKIENELERLIKDINKIKSVDRDEELLKMQKVNQELELELYDLKNQDKTKLVQKEEESKRLVFELNELFENKMNDTLIKDRERKSAIEEIKNIKKQQEELNVQINDNNNKISDLEKEVKTLEYQVENYESYKKFIDKVIEKTNEGNGNVNNDYDKLKEKFENLIERMNEIKDDIEKQELEIKEKKEEQSRLLKTDEKQLENQKILKLEEEAKELTRENEILEKEIEEIMRKNQKKESDNHQIMLSIINLYKKVNKKDKQIHFDIENMKEEKLCEMLNEINDKLSDLIAIYKDLDGNVK